MTTAERSLDLAMGMEIAAELRARVEQLGCLGSTPAGDRAHRRSQPDAPDTPNSGGPSGHVLDVAGDRVKAAS